MNTHRFAPEIPLSAKKLLIGSLPPEGAGFYFSNSSNTRLWDLLGALESNSSEVGKGGYRLVTERKIEILKNLKIGISDIIYQYERDDPSSGKDTDIIPKKYNDLLQLAYDNGIDELVFVYQSALKWFNHSRQSVEPVRLRNLQGKYEIGPQPDVKFKGKVIKCVLLPSPLSRGTRGQTLSFKLDVYRKYLVES